MGSYSQLKDIYQGKVDKVKTKCLTLLREVQREQSLKYQSNLKELQSQMKTVKVKYAEKLGAINQQLESVFSVLNHEYASVTSKYETEYDSLKNYVQLEKQKIESAQQ